MATAVAGPATDDRGFVDSTARCDAPATAVVFGSTPSSRVAICTNSGQYQYRGVRVSDGAKLIVPAEPVDGGFVGTNDGITYTVTSSSLVVKAGGQVIRVEPMVDFHGKVPERFPEPRPPRQRRPPPRPLRRRSPAPLLRR